MFTYPLQQQKHKHKGSLTKLLVLHVYIPYTKNTNINTKFCCRYRHPRVQTDSKVSGLEVGGTVRDIPGPAQFV